MLYSVDAVLGVCCTGCMLYSVYAVLGVCCTRYMLYSVYAVLGVFCTWCMLYSVSTHDHDMEEMEMDDLTLCSAMMVELWTRKREMVMKLKTMWRIQADMGNQGYNLPNWVGKTAYWRNYTPDRDSYLLYWGWSSDSHTKFSQDPIPHDDFFPLLSSLSFSSSSLPSAKNTKLSHCFLSLHAMIKSQH